MSKQLPENRIAVPNPVEESADTTRAAEMAAAEAASRVDADAKRHRTRHTASRVLIYVILAILLIYAFFPTFWLLSTSFKPQLEAFQIPPTWWPRNFTFFSYQILPADQQG